MKTSGELRNSFYKWLEDNPDGKVWDWMYKILKEESNRVQPQVMQKIARDSGIPEYDELAKLWNEGKLDPTALASRMWNKGYNAGYESAES